MIRIKSPDSSRFSLATPFLQRRLICWHTAVAAHSGGGGGGGGGVDGHGGLDGEGRGTGDADGGSAGSGRCGGGDKGARGTGGRGLLDCQPNARCHNSSSWLSSKSNRLCSSLRMPLAAPLKFQIKRIASVKAPHAAAVQYLELLLRRVDSSACETGTSGSSGSSLIITSSYFLGDFFFRVFLNDFRPGCSTFSEMVSCTATSSA